MGNCCGTLGSDDAFSSPGRVLGSAPPQPTISAVPANLPTPAPPAAAGPSSAGDLEARRRAAAAAEARAAEAKPTGKLGSQLQAQRKQTRTDTLREASADEVRRREIESAAVTRTHN